MAQTSTKPLDPAKFRDPGTTAKGEQRASVAFTGLKTLWFNTGTLCNIECASCYIQSSASHPLAIGVTGGEPFMNPDIAELLDETLKRGHDALVLTNAMKPMMRPRVQAALKDLQQRHGRKLSLRVSLDHWREDLHDEERGPGAFRETLDGLHWLQGQGITTAIAGCCQLWHKHSRGGCAICHR